MGREHLLQQVSHATVSILDVILALERHEGGADLVALAAVFGESLPYLLLFVATVGSARHDDMARLLSYLGSLIREGRLASLQELKLAHDGYILDARVTARFVEQVVS